MNEFSMPRKKRLEVINDITEELRKIKMLTDKRWHAIEYASENLITARNFLRAINADAEKQE